MNSLTHRSPIVDFITQNILRTISSENMTFKEEETLDTKIVPKISEEIILKRGFKESPMIVPQLPTHSNPQKEVHFPMPPVRKMILQKRAINVLPIKQGIVSEHKNTSEVTTLSGFKESIGSSNSLIKETPLPRPPIYEEVTSKKENISISGSQTLQSSKVVKNYPRHNLGSSSSAQAIDVSRRLSNSPTQIPINLLSNPPNYGKLYSLIEDPLVEFIECQGPGKNILVTIRGKKQPTKISLTIEEINMLIENASIKTNIPITGEVFRVSWDNIVLNAIISSNIEPSFVIRKVIR